MPKDHNASAETAEPRSRVALSREAIWSKPRTLRKRRRCGSHLSEKHYVEAGQQVIWSALPPDSDVGNPGWWHAMFCLDCAPAELVSSPGGPAGGDAV